MPKVSNTKKTAKEQAEPRPDIIIPAPHKKHTALKWLGGCCAFFLIFVILLVNVLGIAFGTHVFFDNVFSRDLPYQETIVASHGARDDKIALIHLSGVISSANDASSVLQEQGSTQDVLNQLEMAKQDPAVQAVIIETDSPGGSVTASEDLFQKIADVKTAGKPVVTYVHTEAASGAYYAICATDYIIANPTSLNGSIGVILQSYNYGDLLNKYGVHVETFKSGPYKDMLSGARPTTAQEKEIVQGIIDNSYNIFVDHIVKGRGLDKAAVLKVADGRVLTAAQAKAAKLIDATGYEEDAITKAAELGKTESYDVVEYSRKAGFLERLGVPGLGAATSFVTNLLQGHTQATELYFL